MLNRMVFIVELIESQGSRDDCADFVRAYEVEVVSCIEITQVDTMGEVGVFVNQVVRFVLIRITH